jgi:hypothetical protein
MACGARVVGGTDFGILAAALRKQYPIKWRLSTSIDEVVSAIRYGGAVAVCNTKGGATGLFSDSGHYVLAVSVGGYYMTVLDPYLYAGKFDTAARKGKVTLDGNDAYVTPENLAADCKRYNIVERDRNMEIEKITIDIAGKKVPGVLIGGTSYMETRPAVDALNEAQRLDASWSRETGPKVTVGG